MTQTELRPGGEHVEEAEGRTRSRFDTPVVFIGAALIVLLIFSWGFLQDPTRTAATRDPAWYTWRAGMIVQGDPGSVAGEWGPFAMFSGGYRVSVPVIGAYLQDLGGTGASTFAGFMMVLVPVLAGLALASAAYRSTKDWVLSVLTMFVVGAFFLTTPYVGYLDNLFVLYVLAALIAFLEPARRSWGARSAVFMLALLAMFTHPTTCIVFIGTMFAVFGFHLLSMGFKVRKVLDRDLPALLAVLAGFVAGGLLWVLGKFLLWGVAGNLMDAALPPPYTKGFFLNRLGEWIGAQHPFITLPLVVVAVAWIALRAWRTAKPADAYRTMSMWWLLPYLASVLFILMGSVVPYYRFFNSTAAIMSLVAIGLWVITRWIVDRFDANKGLKIVAGLVITVLLGAGFGFVIKGGLEATQWNDPENQWIDQPTREALASVAVIAERQPDRPIVFVNDYAKIFQAYGWSKTFANVGRSGLPPGYAERTFQYFGDLEPFLANERTVSNESCSGILDADEVELKLVMGGKVEGPDGEMVKKPARTECTYDLVSRGFFDEMKAGVEERGGTPLVFMVKGFSDKSDNLKYFVEGAPTDITTQVASDSLVVAEDALVPLGSEVFLVQGDGLATVPQADIDAATAAGAAEKARLANHEGLFADPLHLLQVLLALIILFVIPGLISARWFGLDDWHQKLGLIPAVSIAMNVLAAIFVIAATRSPFGVVNAWMAAALVIIVAVILNRLARRREAKGPGMFGQFFAMLGTSGGNMIDEMSKPFSKKSFRGLMLTQFVSMAGDGVVAGTILATVLNPTNAKTGKDVLALVFLTYLPFALIAPFVGVLADRYDRRKLLVFANNARAALMVFGAVMLLFGIDAVAILSALALLVLGGFRLTLLIKGAGLPDAVGGEDLLLANSLSQAGGTIFQAGGAVVATVLGLIIGNSGVVAILAVVLYAFAAMFARGIDRLKSGTATGGLGQAFKGVISQVVEGVKEIGRRPAAAVGILSFWFTRTLVFGFIALSITFAGFEAITGQAGKGGASKTELAVSLLFAGLGAGIGLFGAQFMKDKVAPAKVIVTFMLLAGGAALIIPFAGRYFATFFAGLGFFLVKVAADTVTQQAMPDDFRGRAYAFFDITYALSYALPAAVLFLAASVNVDLDWVVAAYGGLVILIALGLGAWSKKLGLYRHVSDDLTEEEIVTGVGD